MERPNNPSETKYLLIGEEEFERLLRSYYILGKGLLAFEYLCGHSDLSLIHISEPTRPY